MPCTATGVVNMVHARTLLPLVLENHPHPAGPGPCRRGLYVDCETTGLSSEHDALIELAMLPFTYTTNGAITDVHRDQTRTWRQDPGRPVPPEITHITGLTDEDLASQAIDVATATELLAASHLVVAHNARFDRLFVEWVVATARAAPWACSRHEVPWDPVTFPSRALACLVCGFEAFSPARHRTFADCEAGMWLLTQTLPPPTAPSAALRETAATPTVRVWATSAPFEAKDQLRTRGYRWMAADRDGIPRLWWTDVAPPDLESEYGWLADVDVKRDRFNRHADEIIKDESIPYAEYPCFALSMNADARSFKVEIVKRCLMIYTRTALLGDNTSARQNLQRSVATIRERMTTSLYREYLKRILERLENNESDDPGTGETDTVDALHLSSTTLCALFDENLPPGTALPHWCAPMTLSEYQKRAFERPRLILDGMLSKDRYSPERRPPERSWTIVGDRLIVPVASMEFSRIKADIPDWLLDDTGSSASQISLDRKLTEDFLGRPIRSPSRWAWWKR